MQTTTGKEMPKVATHQIVIKLLKNELFDMAIHSTEKFPEMYMFSLAGKKVYNVNHPLLAQDVLQKNYNNYTKGLPYQYLSILLGNGLITNDVKLA